VATGANGQTDTKTVTVNVAEPPGIVISGGLMQETSYRDFILDASASFSSANSGPLTFFWTCHAAAISNPTVPNPRVQIPNIRGTYLFDVKVTDSKGLSTTATVAVKLVFAP
jgi:hypothetical protein